MMIDRYVISCTASDASRSWPIFKRRRWSKYDDCFIFAIAMLSSTWVLLPGHNATYCLIVQYNYIVPLLKLN